MKTPWAVVLIPNVGNVRVKHSQAHGVAAQASGLAEARLMFKTDEHINSIEVVVLEGKEMSAALSQFVYRT